MTDLTQLAYIREKFLDFSDTDSASTIFDAIAEIEAARKSRCPECAGIGWTFSAGNESYPIFQVSVPCPACLGSGRR